MAAPTTAIEIAWATEIYRKHIERWGDDFSMLFINPLIAMISNHIFLQRPLTDDMMQMCIDLGIDIPNYQPISFDGLAFKWKGY